MASPLRGGDRTSFELPPCMFGSAQGSCPRRGERGQERQPCPLGCVGSPPGLSAASQPQNQPRDPLPAMGEVTGFLPLSLVLFNLPFSPRCLPLGAFNPSAPRTPPTLCFPRASGARQGSPFPTPQQRQNCAEGERGRSPPSPGEPSWDHRDGSRILATPCRGRTTLGLPVRNLRLCN